MLESCTYGLVLHLYEMMSTTDHPYIRAVFASHYGGNPVQSFWAFIIINLYFKVCRLLRETLLRRLAKKSLHLCNLPDQNLPSSLSDINCETRAEGDFYELHFYQISLAT